MTQTAMATYYQDRAREYEAIYDKPERQADLARMKAWLAAETAGRSILEIACGTGWWTAVAAPAAASIFATDYNDGPLEIARSKRLGAHVSFSRADAYALPENLGAFDCGMAHFWWSHIQKERQQAFLSHFTQRLRPGGRLLMIDNCYVEGSSTPISRTDSSGDTWQTRTLANGSTHEVLKNFPSDEELSGALAPTCRDVQIHRLGYFWTVSANRS